jgi:type IV secretion system protein VirD4
MGILADWSNPANKETLPSHFIEERNKYYKYFYTYVVLSVLVSFLVASHAPLIEYIYSNGVSNSVAILLGLMLAIPLISTPFLVKRLHKPLGNAWKKIKNLLPGMNAFFRSPIISAIKAIFPRPLTTVPLTLIIFLLCASTIYVLEYPDSNVGSALDIQKLGYYEYWFISFDYPSMFNGYFRGMDLISLSFYPVIKMIMWIFIPLIAVLFPLLFNPYKKIIMKSGWADWCDDETLERMEAMNQVGIKGGFMMAFGRWSGRKRKGQIIQMIEPLSCLCLAPPGTGKTASLIVPTIIMCNKVSMIINDPKPELYEMTGAHRASVSKVYMLDWSEVDVIDKDNPENSKIYPRFNFLSPKMVPPAGPHRDTYIDAICKVLIPEQKGGGDTYFTDKGRAAMTGFIHYLIAKVGDAGNYDGLPKEYKDAKMEPSLPMLADWLALSQMQSMKAAEPQPAFPEDADEMNAYDVQAAQPPSANDGLDALGKWIKGLVDTVDIGRTDGKSTYHSPRAYAELAPLVNMADKERSGILGSMDKALLPFKNEAVKQRTSFSDFTPDMFRGVFQPPENIKERELLSPDHPNALTKEKKKYWHIREKIYEFADEEYKAAYMNPDNWVPVTLYVSINQSIAEAFSTITSLLYEVLAKAHISQGPWEFNSKTGEIVGPYPICYVLDEFAKLPKTPAVLSGPDLARSKKASFLFAAQDYGQLKQQYSEHDVSIINTTTAVKYILPQNNSDTIDTIAKMVGSTTIERTSRSTNEGISKSANPWGWSESKQLEEARFLRHEDIASMKQGKVLLIVQNFMNRPMMLDSLLYFLDPDIKDKVRARGHGPIATVIVPEEDRLERLASLYHEKEEKEKRLREEKANDNKKYDPPEEILKILSTL